MRNSSFLLQILPVMALIGLAAAARGEFIFDAEVPLDPKVEVAIDRAQEWLAKGQQPNGSWGTCNGRNGLALMALMVNGSTPGHGKYGDKVAKGIEFLIGSQHENGYLVVGESGSMYQHALATLALAEAYGMTQNPAIRESLTKAIHLILKAQSPSGGWRYTPVPGDQDLSVTVMQIMALRAAADTGLYVPTEAVDFGVRYVRACWSAPSMTYGYGGPSGDGGVRMTAAGTVCLQSCGLEDDPNVPKAVQYLMAANRYGQQVYKNSDNWECWYGHYYASVALYHYGGDAWKSYYPKLCESVLRDWAKAGHYGDVLTTSWAILSIGTPYRYLPIYQR
ncbi:MAG: prenyltransferase/squalene oxidase repeat-containing protein [bacterium]